MKLSLKINGITVDEAKKIMEIVRSIEQQDTDRFIFCEVLGLEKMSKEVAVDILKQIFPQKGKGEYMFRLQKKNPN